MTKRGNKGVNIPRSRRLRIYARDNWTCWICGNPVTHKTASLDHLLPVLHGGTDKQDNLKTAHKSCNLKRGNAMLKEDAEALSRATLGGLDATMRKPRVEPIRSFDPWRQPRS